MNNAKPTPGPWEFDRRVMMGHAEQTMTDRYTHEDWERMREGVEKIAAEVTAKPRKLAGSDYRSDSLETLPGQNPIKRL